MQLWLVIQPKLQLAEREPVVIREEIQGIFSSEEAADRACREGGDYYFGPYTLDEELPRETVGFGKARAPRSGQVFDIDAGEWVLETGDQEG